jgi:hypothetical protein
MNGHEENDDFISLVDDGFVHEVQVTAGVMENKNQSENSRPVAV